MTPLLACLLLFLAVGVAFLLVNLLVGKLIRPNKPETEKGTIYECGEPTIGSAWIQFDLRFYVVALLFVIFDVEVAFFFPWAVVFGKTNDVRTADLPATPEARREYAQKVAELAPTPAEKEAVLKQYESMDEDRFKTEFKANQEAAQGFAWFAFFEILVFFGVLLVGFAYLWKRGDLAWVRSTLAERPTETAAAPGPVSPPEEKVLVGTRG